MFVNWMLETKKWQLLIGKYENIDFLRAFKAVLSGLALSIITPNQIGDFVGRVFHLKTLGKIKGSLITVIGHTAQVMMTAGLGLFALLYFIQDRFEFVKNNYNLLFLSSIALIIIFFSAFINSRYIFTYIVKFTPAKIHHLSEVFVKYEPREMFNILFLSFVRYFVFLFQYYLLLLCFDVDMPIMNAFLAIIATFCVQSMVPSFLLLEIGLRGASAMLFFGIFSDNLLGILLSAYSLWIINIMIPSLLGLFYIYKLKFKSA